MDDQIKGVLKRLFQKNRVSILNAVYPVGSIYITTMNVNPKLYLLGEWQLIKDRFLLGAGGLYNVNDTGGTENVALTTDNLPSHNHSASSSSGYNNVGHNHSGTTGTESAGHSHSTTVSTVTNGRLDRLVVKDIVTDYVRLRDSDTGLQYLVAASVKPVGEIPLVSNHSHTVNVGQELSTHTHTFITSAQSGNHTHSVSTTVGNTGKGVSHSNMPPYIAVYMWERIK